MDGLLGVAGMIITSDYGSFPHSLPSTSKMIKTISTVYIARPSKHLKKLGEILCFSHYVWTFIRMKMGS